MTTSYSYKHKYISMKYYRGTYIFIVDDDRLLLHVLKEAMNLNRNNCFEPVVTRFLKNILLLYVP